MKTESKGSNPVCHKCSQRMRWSSTEIIIPLEAYEERHIDVFHCDTCDKYTARAVAKKPPN
jgi:uncharacterized protein with PIN domain